MLVLLGWAAPKQTGWQEGAKFNSTHWLTPVHHRRLGLGGLGLGLGL